MFNVNYKEGIRIYRITDANLFSKQKTSILNLKYNQQVTKKGSLKYGLIKFKVLQIDLENQPKKDEETFSNYYHGFAPALRSFRRALR